MDLESGVLSAIVGFSGGVIALLGNKAFERRMGKELDEAEASRDLTVQLASALDGLEGFLQPLATGEEPKDLAALVKMHSGYDLPALPLALDKLLASFSSPEVHRLLVLLYGRLDLFAKRASDHRAAYYWLLDSPSAEWGAPAHRERIDNIRVCREYMLEYVKDILQYGYELIDAILPGTESVKATLMRGTALAYLEFLKSKYGLTRTTARVRSAYYRTRSSARFAARDEHALVVWNDGIVEALGGRGALLCAQIAGEPSPRYIPAHLEVALPSHVDITDFNLRRADGGAWIPLPGRIQRTFAKVGPHTLRLPDDLLAKLA